MRVFCFETLHDGGGSVEDAASGCQSRWATRPQRLTDVTLMFRDANSASGGLHLLAAAGVASTSMKTWLVLAVAMAAGVAARSSQESVPREWVDPDTGHRVVRLSDEPGSQSLYLHQYAYTPDGKKLLITTPTGVSAIDLKTRAIEKVVDGRVSLIMTGRKTGRAYYVKDGWSTRSILTPRRVARSPRSPLTARSSTVNADETLLAGTITEGSVPDEPPPPAGTATSLGTNSRGQLGRDNYPGKG